MCGICGLWNLDRAPVDPALLVDMRDSMAHRGPDGEGCILFEASGGGEPILYQTTAQLASGQTAPTRSYDLGLGHRRLSIIDLNTGDQPMSNEDGSVWIVFNGEIYNYRELREDLRARGHVFRTTSDTEVIVHCYEEYGEDCPARLNGIFGFAIWDSRRRQLFLARDHFGVKPLYYSLQGSRFYFASELKAILADPRVPRELDLDALNLCLTFRHTPSPWTLFKSIRKLAPGSSVVVRADGIHEAKYWRKEPWIDRTTTKQEWIARLRQSLEQAVVRQMVSDVPIGISLSSGVDSTTVLALMSKHSSGPVRAFTVGFSGREDSSEVEPARERARQFGAEFFSQSISSSDYADFMGRYLWHLEEPIGNESAAAYYFVAEMAHQQGIKVLLNGQGADEAFAGYRRYVGAAYSRLLALGALPPLPQILPQLLGGTALGERYQRFLYTLDGTEEDDRFLRVLSILPEGAKRQLVRPEHLAQVDQGLPRQYIHEQLAEAPRGTSLERMTYLDARTSLPDNLLLCEDKMAMAASVEARVPFLDLPLMDVAESIPGRLKLRGLRDKYIHRQACMEWVGREVTSRPQIGFDNAVDLWLRAQLGDQMTRMTESSDSFISAYLNPAYVRQLIEEHRERRRDHQRVLFLLMSLESWHQVFFNAAAVHNEAAEGVVG